MSYHQFTNEDGERYGSFEVFYLPAVSEHPAGYYWQACFPGCLPDGEAVGPFPTKDAAIADAEEV